MIKQLELVKWLSRHFQVKECEQKEVSSTMLYSIVQVSRLGVERQVGQHFREGYGNIGDR